MAKKFVTYFRKRDLIVQTWKVFWSLPRFWAMRIYGSGFGKEWMEGEQHFINYGKPDERLVIPPKQIDLTLWSTKEDPEGSEAKKFHKFVVKELKTRLRVNEKTRDFLIGKAKQVLSELKIIDKAEAV